MSKTKTQRIAELNDRCRTAFGIRGRLMLTEGIASLEDASRSTLLEKVMNFDAMDGGSEDPSDTGQTVRVLTIMLASEY